jgi:hypothetical protein
MQEFFVNKDEKMYLIALREKHALLGFKGDCIVRFAPEHYGDVVLLPSFLGIDRYKHTVIVDDNEIGICELFHMVPESPPVYVGFGESGAI